jgi:hypothetical protein
LTFPGTKVISFMHVIRKEVLYEAEF